MNDICRTIIYHLRVCAQSLLRRSPIALCLFCLVLLQANDCLCQTRAGIREVKAVGAVVGYSQSEMVKNPIGQAPTRCYARLLLRIAQSGAGFRAGQYIILQYDEPLMPCELPNEMFSGQGLWAFRLKREAVRVGSIKESFPVIDQWKGFTHRQLTDSAKTVHLAHYGNLIMLGGRRIEDLRLSKKVREFKFGPQDFERAATVTTAPRLLED